MTIIKNNKIEQSNFPIFFLIGVFAVFLTGAIFLYSRLVNAKHEISAIKIVVRDADVRNAELKTAIQKIFSQQNLKEISDDLNLIAEKNPHFVKRNQFVKND